MLSIDCLLNVVAAVEKLTDVAVEGIAVTPDASAGVAPHSTKLLAHLCAAVELQCQAAVNALVLSVLTGTDQMMCDLHSIVYYAFDASMLRPLVLQP